MARSTQTLVILQPHLPAALHDRDDMVGIPGSLGGGTPDSPTLLSMGIKKIFPALPRKPIPQDIKIPHKLYRVGFASRTNPSIPLEHLLADVTGVRPDLPFVHAFLRTERTFPFWDLFAAAPAK